MHRVLNSQIQPQFRLLRYFAVTSAAILVAVAILLYAYYRQTAMDDLLVAAEQRNTVLARSLANAIWLYHGDRIGEMSDADIDRMMGRPETAYLDRTVAQLSVGLPVLRIKIFNADGVVVFSTNHDNIGMKTDHNPNLLESARRGRTSSQILYRNDPWPEDAGIAGRDVVETYFPLRGPAGEVRGVFELYSDVTDRLGSIGRISAVLLGGLLVGFAVLYGGLLLVVRRADQIIRSQYVSLRESRERLIAANSELIAEIAQRAEIEAEMHEARDAAQAASRAKSLFLANMSHELRTPLNAIIGFSEIIADEMYGRDRPDRYRGCARDIRKAGQHLLVLVSDILDLTRIEAGKMPVAFAPVAVGELLREMIRGLEPQIAGNRNRIELHCPETVGMMVSDGNRIRSILANLLGNAAKFTSDGWIDVTVWREDGGTTSWVVFRISDSGIGIEPDRIAEMFEDFAQQDGSITRRYGGSGLGLAISRRSSEALGGRIEIESAPGEGTTVLLRIPDRSDTSSTAGLAAE